MMLFAKDTENSYTSELFTSPLHFSIINQNLYHTLRTKSLHSKYTISVLQDFLFCVYNGFGWVPKDIGRNQQISSNMYFGCYLPYIWNIIYVSVGSVSKCCTRPQVILSTYISLICFFFLLPRPLLTCLHIISDNHKWTKKNDLKRGINFLLTDWFGII